jgi:hypothetical protein
MKEDVKKKHFSTPLQESLCGNLHPGPFSFLERTLFYRFGSPHSSATMPISVDSPHGMVS